MKKAFNDKSSLAGWKKVNVMSDKTEIYNRKNVRWEIRDSETLAYRINSEEILCSYIL